MTKDIIKQYGDVLHSANSVIDNPPRIISVSPKLDIALRGGVPEGSLFILTGPEKVGKTVHAIQFAKNAQDLKLDDGSDRMVYYGNIEGRIKKRDLEGIYGLDLSEDKFQLIGSSQGNILSGEKYLAIFDNIIHTQPHAVGILDSFSALSSEKELTGEMGDVEVAGINRVLSRFTRKVCNVLPINKVTLVGITHLMANIQKFGAGKSKVEKSGTSLKYAQDVKLWATHKEPLKQGDTQIGQKVHWVIENSAIGPPGEKVTTYIKYGRGVWNEYEIAELSCDFGITEKSGAWFTLPTGDKVQGLPAFTEFLEQNDNAYEDLKQQVFEIVGMD